MISKDFFAALDELEQERGIDKATFLSALEAGIASGFKKEIGEARNIEVRCNELRCEIKVFAYKNIVEEVTDADKEISLAEAKEIKKSYKIGDRVQEEIAPKEFSRIAVQVAKQVIMQRINDITKERVMSEMNDKEGEIAKAQIVKIDGDTVYLEILSTRVTAILSGNDKVPGERYEVGKELMVYVKNTRNNSRGPQVLVSRSAPGLVKRLFEKEVPEIATGDVEIKGVVRDAGYRTKMSVYSNSRNIDAVGACIGQRGARINAVVTELNGEKIDIVPWSEEPEKLVAGALSPAKAVKVVIDKENNMARVFVEDDKLSLAIGKGGQNVRLAVKLTGWKIDVKTISQGIEMGEDFGD